MNRLDLHGLMARTSAVLVLLLLASACGSGVTGGQGASISRAQAAANATSKSALYNHNCIYVDGVGSAGVHPAVPHDIVIRNSILRNCTAAGIEVNAGDAITILHNKVADNSWWTVFDTSGIGLYHPTDSPSASAKNGYKNFIVGNEVWG